MAIIRASVLAAANKTLVAKTHRCVIEEGVSVSVKAGLTSASRAGLLKAIGTAGEGRISIVGEGTDGKKYSCPYVGDAPAVKEFLEKLEKADSGSVPADRGVNVTA